MKDIINEVLMSDDGNKLCASIEQAIMSGQEAMSAIKEHCDALRSSGSDRDMFLAETYQIMMEADVQYLNMQTFVISQLADNRIVDKWGKENVKNWDILNNTEKTEILYRYFASVKALGKIREYMVNSPDVSDTAQMHIYDVHDVEEPHTGIKSKHWEQFKNSVVFKDLSEMLLSYF